VVVFYDKLAIFQLHFCISWQEQVTFDEMTALCQTNMLSSIFIVLALWNFSLQVDMLLH